jgi:hypothetical protein
MEHHTVTHLLHCGHRPQDGERFQIIAISPECRNTHLSRVCEGVLLDRALIVPCALFAGEEQGERAETGYFGAGAHRRTGGRRCSSCLR